MMTPAQKAESTRALKRIVAQVGSYEKLAAALNSLNKGRPDRHLSRQGVYWWAERQVPDDRAKELEEISRFTVPRRKLRPDLYGD